MQLQNLWNLQEIDQAIKQTEKDSQQKETIESLKKDMEAIKIIEEDLKALKALNQQTGREIRKLELELQGLIDQKRCFEERLYSGQTSILKEMESMGRKIKQLEGQIEEIEDKVLIQMEKKETQIQHFKQLKMKLTILKKDYRKAYNDYQSTKKELNIKQANAQQTRAELLALIPDSLLKQYNQLQIRFGLQGIARLENNRCSGCQIDISRIQIQAIRQGDQEVYCEYCGRFIAYEI